MNFKEAKQFVAHFATGDYTPEEYATFLLWLKGATVNELNVIADEHESMHERWDVPVTEPSAEWKGVLEERLDGVLEPVEETSGEAVVRELGSRSIRWPWVAAASVAALLVGGVVLYTQKDAIKPATAHADLPAMTNTMKVGRGEDGKQFVLADGSKVWLNSASTLRSPANFTGERVVELSGEAYFEVAHNPEKPFRVLIRDAQVEVLGTSFNVMAYDNEPLSRTTLLDGSVRMETGSNKVELKPGEQAELAYPSTGEGSKLRLVPGVINTNDVLAWRKGEYKFTNEKLSAVMRVIQRYYNVETQIDANVPDKLVTGIVSKAHGITQTLHELEASTTGVRFKLNEKTVKVTL